MALVWVVLSGETGAGDCRPLASPTTSPGQMGVITLCLAPNSLVGGGGEGARPRTSRTWPGNAEMRLESACDNGYRGDLANGPQLMSPAPICFFHLHESHVFIRYLVGATGPECWYSVIFYILHHLLSELSSWTSSIWRMLQMIALSFI